MIHWIQHKPQNILVLFSVLCTLMHVPDWRSIYLLCFWNVMLKTVNMYNSLFAYNNEQTRQGIMFYSINYKVSDLLIEKWICRIS